MDGLRRTSAGHRRTKEALAPPFTSASCPHPGPASSETWLLPSVLNDDSTDLTLARFGPLMIGIDKRPMIIKPYMLIPFWPRFTLAMIIPLAFTALALWDFLTIAAGQLSVESPGLYKQTPSGAKRMIAAMILYTILVGVICWLIGDGIMMSDARWKSLVRQRAKEASIS